MNRPARLVIESIVKQSMQSKAPGLYEAMDLRCRILHGKGCVDLLLDEPVKLKDTLLKMYGDSTLSVHFIVKHLLIRPLLTEWGAPGLEEELVTSFLSDPRKFRETLVSLLQLNPRSSRTNGPVNT